MPTKPKLKYCKNCGSPMEKYLSVESAAELLDCSQQFFRNMIRDRKITYHKFGRLVRIAVSEIEKLRIEIPSFEKVYDDHAK